MQAMTWADWRLAGAALAGFLLTLLLIIRFHWQAVLALLTGSLTIGLLTGMPAGEIIRAVHTGVGQSLQEVALLVGIGSMLGAVLDLTGGAQVLAEALLITVLAAVYLLGYRGGYSWAELEKPMTQSLASAGNILLLMAAGGVLRYMLEYSGLSALLGELLAAVRMPPILAGFLLAGAIRVAIGSSTAAISMTAGILAGLPGALPTPLYAACTAVAVCAGGTLCSHLNDVGFWLAKACLQADEKTTLQVWTVLTGIFGTAAFAAALLISLFA